MEYTINEQQIDGSVIVKVIIDGKDVGIDHDATHEHRNNHLRRCPVCDKIILIDSVEPIIN